MQRGVQNDVDLLAPELRVAHRTPRYARVNTLRQSEEAVRAALEQEGYTYGREVTADPDVPALLTFPPATDLHAHPLVESGALILQDKASCFPALVLAPQPGWHVVDACAAPGNKTTHLAALMQG